MTSSFLAGAQASLGASRILIGLWLILSTLQWLTAAPLFSEGGLLPWAELGRLRRPFIAQLCRRMSVRGLRLWLTVQLLGALLLLSNPSAPIVVASLMLLILSYGAFLALTGEFWSGGDDKMGMIAMSGALVVCVGVLLKDPGVALAGTLISGGQLVVCYTTAGLSKAALAAWRNGTFLSDIMATEFWGHPLTRFLARYPAIARLAAWCVILAESLFPLALLMPRPWLIAALGSLLLFHFVTAVTMRLNAFPWAFAATYPSVLLLAGVLHSALGIGG